MASLHHNAGLCLYALGQYDEALPFLNRARTLNPELWQALLVSVKALRKLGRVNEAQQALASESRHDVAVLENERASFFLHELGDASSALEVVQQLNIGTPDNQLLGCIASLYDPGVRTAEVVSNDLRSYAEHHLVGRLPLEPQKAATNQKLKIGVISPQLRATPVFFFGIGALRQLAQSVELVFFHRGTKEDWATVQFRAIGDEWVDVAALAPAALAVEIRRHNLDVLIDMGGWMDTQALMALSSKPARRMYKWVGGQSATTGLTAFDGFISDFEQSPPELQSLYSEPLCLLESGYVTYDKPAYFPSPQAAEQGIVLGIIANPSKISRSFLQYLSTQCTAWREQGIEPTLRFIEHKFQQPELQKRIRLALGDSAPVEFVVPEGHVAYLNQVARLHTVIDTFPYTGGLTTMEALMLGVPVRTRVGALFCERHTLAHCRYAGMEPNSYLQKDWFPETSSPAPRQSLLSADSPRLRHDRLADELLRLFTTT
jgi:predicted O-linked N-acetylglucosamine transferase (SPINDLY family)